MIIYATFIKYENPLVNVDEMQDFNKIVRIFAYFDQQCLKIETEKSCSNSSYFYCDESMKCIPYDRVSDGMIDCYFEEDKLFNACHLMIQIDIDINQIQTNVYHQL